jgi:hypothetical protein
MAEDPVQPMEVPAFLTGIITLTQRATDTLVANGINSFEDFIEMSDKDVTGMCDKCRNPGGMVRRGGRGVAANDMVPDRGVQIGYLQEKSLRQLRFYIFHCNRIQRAFDPDSTSLDDLRTLWSKRFDLEVEGTKADSTKEEIKPLKKESDVRKALEDLDNLLMNRLGAGGSPLAYCNRGKAKGLKVKYFKGCVKCLWIRKSEIRSEFIFWRIKILGKCFCRQDLI